MMTHPRTGDRLAQDRTAGLLSFDAFNWSGPRWRVLWLETRLDCRLWSYYCDLKMAMAQLHTMLSPVAPLPDEGPDLIVVGPRFTTNNYHVWDSLGINRSRWASVPLVVVQNKLFDCVKGETCGGPPAVKLEWARQVGAAAAFTWLTRHHEFTHRSAVRHHWMPFAADVTMYGQYADGGATASQDYDVGFSGTNDASKYALRAAMLTSLTRFAKRHGWRTSIGSWSRASTVGNYSKMSRKEYVRRIAATKIWLSTTGPDGLVGTRFFEVLASGTTLLLCNRPAEGGPWTYSGLFEDGVHVATFSSMEELRTKLLYYLANDDARWRIVRAAHDLAGRMHSWGARARFISAVAQRAIDAHPTGAPWYVPPPPQPHSASGGTSYMGCFAEARGSEQPGGGRMGSESWIQMVAPPHGGPFTSGFNVSGCEQSCAVRGDEHGRRSSHFALVCGGFCKGGDVHNRGRCLCGGEAAWRGLQGRRLRDGKERTCDSTCSLHDARPCGAAGAMAVYELTA